MNIFLIIKWSHVDFMRPSEFEIRSLMAWGKKLLLSFIGKNKIKNKKKK